MNRPKPIPIPADAEAEAHPVPHFLCGCGEVLLDLFEQVAVTLALRYVPGCNRCPPGPRVRFIVVRLRVRKRFHEVPLAHLPHLARWSGYP